MVTRDIVQRLLAILNETRSRVNTLESREVALLTATQTLTNKTLTTPVIGSFTNAQHAHTDAASGGTIAGHLHVLTTERAVPANHTLALDFLDLSDVNSGVDLEAGAALHLIG